MIRKLSKANLGRILRKSCKYLKRRIYYKRRLWHLMTLAAVAAGLIGWYETNFLPISKHEREKSLNESTLSTLSPSPIIENESLPQPSVLRENIEFSSEEHSVISKFLRQHNRTWENSGIPPEEFKDDIPRIVHLIWISSAETSVFLFHHLICLLAIQRFVGPEQIILWVGGVPPRGNLWRTALRRVNQLKVRRRHVRTHIFGVPLNVMAHKADVMRMELLVEFGGIYMDLDTIVLRSLNPLLKYPHVQGNEGEACLANGFIMSRKSSLFLNVWYKLYQLLDDGEWGYHSVILPYKLSRIFPNWVHVEWNTIIYPTYSNLDMIFGPVSYDWSRNYAMHLYYRLHNPSDPQFQPRSGGSRLQEDAESIKYLDSTLGQIFRHVYYGDAELWNRTNSF